MSHKLYRASVEDGKVVFEEKESAIRTGLWSQTKNGAVEMLRQWETDLRDLSRANAIEMNAQVSTMNASIRALEDWREE